MIDSFSQLNYQHIVIIFILLFFATYFMRSIVVYKTKLHQQNIQLIKLYLDQKFITKLLNIFGDTKHSPQEIVEKLIDRVKEYFQMDDAIIYSPNSSSVKPLPGAYNKSLIAEHINNNYKTIIHNIKADKMIIDTFVADRLEAVLYIMPLSNDCDTLIAFAQYNTKATLDNYEIETLQDSILGILSSAFKIQRHNFMLS